MGMERELIRNWKRNEIYQIYLSSLKRAKKNPPYRCTKPVEGVTFALVLVEDVGVKVYVNAVILMGKGLSTPRRTNHGRLARL
tara:strand:- start:1565 stop:1813 length:249 start_codon:yes stop_codon:yes gene_type:complete